MEEHNLTNEQILAFSTALFQAERSQATIEKYLRSVRAFSLFWTVGPSRRIPFWPGRSTFREKKTIRPPLLTHLWQP